MKKQFFIAIAMLLLFITGCQKDDDNTLILPETNSQSTEIDYLLSQLSLTEKNFFTKNYASESNQFVQSQIQVRGENDQEYLDLLFSQLLELNSIKPFILGMIEDVGYPFWNKARILSDQNSKTTKAVILPFARLKENFTSFYLIAILDFKSKPIYYFIDKSKVEEIIKSGDLFSIEQFDFVLGQFIYFDKSIFAIGNHEYFPFLKELSKNIDNEETYATTRDGWEMFPCDEFEYEQLQSSEASTRGRSIFCYKWSGGGSSPESSPESPFPNDPYWGGGGGTNGGYPNSSSISIQVMINTCGSHAPGEPTDGSLSNTELTLCNQLNTIVEHTGIHENDDRIARLYKKKVYWNAVSAFLLNGNTSSNDIEMVITFLDLLVGNMITSDMSWGVFVGLYNLVVNELKPLLGLNSGEIYFLLGDKNSAEWVKTFMDENSNLIITDFRVINNVTYLLDSDGILHVNLDPLDMENSTNEEKLNHVLKLINLMRIYHCTNEFEAIDWRDYIFPLYSPNFTADWVSPLGETVSVGLNLDLTLATLPEHYLMSSQISDSFANSSTSWKYRWDRYVPNSNFPIPMLSIVTPNSGIDDVEAAINPDCN